MDALRYGDFSLSLHQRVVGERVPLSGAMELTRRCPLACAHCYNNLPMDDRPSRRAELARKELCRIFDEIAGAGCLWLLLTGGEPLARGDFLDIYTDAKQRGFLLTLFTNGTLITPRIADHLAEWRPFSIEITLYGRTAETYERITRVAGSYERCLRGIRLLMERGLPLHLKTVVSSLNKHELWEMKRFAEEDLGVRFRFDAMINCRLDCSRAPADYRLAPHEIVDLDLRDAKRVAEWKTFAQRFGGPVLPAGQRDQLYHCGAGVSTFSVDPSGRLFLCGLTHGECYDLRTGTFREGWDRFLLGVRQQKVTRETKCVACEIKAMCGMCPANGALENGDPEEPVDFLCRVAHLRAYALGLTLPPHGDCEYCKGGTGYAELMRPAGLMTRRPDHTPDETKERVKARTNCMAE